MVPTGIHSNDASGPRRTEEVKVTRSLKLSAELAAVSAKKMAPAHAISTGAVDGLGRRMTQRQAVHNRTNTPRQGMAKITVGEVISGLSRERSQRLTTATHLRSFAPHRWGAQYRCRWRAVVPASLPRNHQIAVVIAATFRVSEAS